MGVNLPAHLVVIKGTKRYVGESETAHREAAGYKEYTQTEVRHVALPCDGYETANLPCQPILTCDANMPGL